MRALAHPLRLRLLSAVRRARQLTAADAARELGISHGLASHHLRLLAKYGFVEPADGKDARERPWRLPEESARWEMLATARTAAGADVAPPRPGAAEPNEPAPADKPARAQAIQAEAALTNYLRSLDRRPNWPAPWRRYTGLGRAVVYLSLSELSELEEAIESLLLRWVEERPVDDVSRRPAGSVPIEITHVVVPLEEPPQG